MATLNKRVNFVDSEDGIRIRHALEEMATNKTFNTDSTYSADAVLYTDNLIPFVDKHMNYLNAHPRLDADSYIANLRLMTRIR